MITKDVLAYSKALSVKLQGRYIDIVSAHNHINFVLTTLKQAREDIEAVHSRMFDRAIHLSSSVNVVESLPRTTNRQQHRSNTPATTPSEYFKLFRIVCTLGVTSAECERSISRLRCLKTYLRSTMTEAQLNGLALLHIHRDIMCSSDQVVIDFAQRHPRRMPL